MHIKNIVHFHGKTTTLNVRENLQHDITYETGKLFKKLNLVL